MRGEEKKKSKREFLLTSPWRFDLKSFLPCFSASIFIFQRRNSLPTGKKNKLQRKWILIIEHFSLTHRRKRQRKNTRIEKQRRIQTFQFVQAFSSFLIGFMSALAPLFRLHECEVNNRLQVNRNAIQTSLCFSLNDKNNTHERARSQSSYLHFHFDWVSISIFFLFSPRWENAKQNPQMNSWKILEPRHFFSFSFVP